MKLSLLSARAISTIALVLATPIFGQMQTAAGHRQPNQQTENRPLTVGDWVEIQASDGSWIKGTVRGVDQASGKYEVVLTNGMSGSAPASALRRTSSLPASQVAPSPASGGPQQASQTPSGGGSCAGQAGCVEVRDFAALVTDFRLSAQGSWRVADLTVRFLNKTGQPLTLGYVSGSGLMLDDQSNRMNMKEEVTRGMGQIRSGEMDPKFVMQSGESADAQFEFVMQQSNNEIFGTSFELNLTLRELRAAGASQYALGTEYPLHFASLGQTAALGAAAAAPATGTVVQGQNYVAQGNGQAVANTPAVIQNDMQAQPDNGKAKRGLGGVIGSRLSGISGALGQLPPSGKAASVASTVNNYIPGFAGTGQQNASGSDASGTQSQGIAGFIPSFGGGAAQSAPGTSPQGVQLNGRTSTVPGFSAPQSVVSSPRQPATAPPIAGSSMCRPCTATAPLRPTAAPAKQAAVTAKQFAVPAKTLPAAAAKQPAPAVAALAPKAAKQTAKPAATKPAVKPSATASATQK